MGRRTSGIVTVAGALVVALAVVAAYALGTAGRSPAVAGSPPTDHPEPTMTTSGQGSATGIPDQLSFTVAVSQTQADVGTALAGTSRQMRAVLRSMAGLGVRPKDLQTTGLHVGPHYSYSNGSTHIAGYTVTQRARVTVRDLGRGGQAIGLAARAAGNSVRISGVSLSISDREALLARARRAAVRDAMAKAREYAAVSGQQVGQMQSLVEVHSAAPGPQRMPFAGAMDLAAATAKAPIRAGRQDLGVRVKVVWVLGPAGGHDGRG